MATIKHIFKGESLSMLFTFPADYDMARIQSHGIWIGGTEFTGVIIGQGVELKLTSLQTDLMSGNQRVSLWLDDVILGVRKPYVGDLAVGNTNALPDNESTSEVYDVIVNVDISVTAIEVGDLMFNYVKGDPLTYDDLTPEQIAELQQPATDAIASIQEVELAVEQAEGLRVQAELNRQSDTATAIFNAEQATDDANDAALLANEKAGLANNAAILANEKAGLAATATTQANDARDGANNAAESATNLVSSYATDLASKELKANKQNSLAPDGTGTKFPTVDAVNAGLANSNLLATYVHSGNLEVAPTAVDLATGTFTKTAHGLINGDRITPIINIGEYVYPFNVYPSGLTNTDYGHYVVGVTPNTFQISLTSGGTPVTFITNALMDLTKWHFERIVLFDYSNVNIKLTNSFKIIYSLRTLRQGNLYLAVYDVDKWIGAATIPQTADVAASTTVPNSVIGMSHIGYAEQKYIASPNMSSIHMTARIFQTGTTLNRYSLRYADSIRVVNSNYMQTSNFWIFNIYPANGFSFNIYKL